MKPYWAYCYMCGPMVVCGTCGNPSCNGGKGPEGKGTCRDCDAAHAKCEAEMADFQYEWLDNKAPHPFNSDFTAKDKLLENIFGTIRR